MQSLIYKQINLTYFRDNLNIVNRVVPRILILNVQVVFTRSNYSELSSNKYDLLLRGYVNL